MVTPENRRQFMETQKQIFKDQYKSRLDKGKVEEELTDKELEREADKFARFVVNREKKHLQAYIRGDQYYKYQNQMLPVITSDFAKTARTADQIIDINKVETEEE